MLKVTNIKNILILISFSTIANYSRDGWIYMTVKTNGENFINKKFPKMTFYYGSKGNIGTEIKKYEEILNKEKDIEDICIKIEDTEKITSLKRFFKKCNGLIKIDMSEFIAKNIENLNSMFDGCKNLEYVNVSNWETKKLEKADNLFKNCIKLEKIEGLNDWNVCHVVDMCSMFKNCESLEYLDLNNWRPVNVKWYKQMFAGCKKLKILKFNYLKNLKTNSTIFSALFPFSSLSSIILFLNVVIIGVLGVLGNILLSQTVAQIASFILFLLYLFINSILLDGGYDNFFDYGKLKMRSMFNGCSKLKFLSLTKSILETKGRYNLGKSSCFLKSCNDLIAVSINPDSIKRIGYFSNKNVYFCCKKGEKEILNEITKNKYDSRIIECDLKEVDKFFEENIDLDYENLKNKFEKIFLNIPDDEQLENPKNNENLEKEEEK